MKLELRWLHSPDVIDLQKYRPADEGNFSLFVQIFVGIKGKEGEESFDITLCTPKWLISTSSEEDVIFGRHYVIVFQYDYDRLVKVLRDAIEGIDAKTWDESCEIIGRIGRWEFEDYRSSTTNS